MGDNFIPVPSATAGYNVRTIDRVVSGTVVQEHVFQIAEPVAGVAIDPRMVTVSGVVSVTGGGGGTQYTEGDVQSITTGNIVMYRETDDAIHAVNFDWPLPVSDQYITTCDTDNVTVTNTVNVAQSGTWSVETTPYLPPNIVVGGVTIGTSSTMAGPQYMTADSIELTNNGSSKLYVSFSTNVTQTSSQMGWMVLPGGCWASPPGIRVQAFIYGICDATSTTENIAYCIMGSFPD
jgi:hypothetical protein